MGLSPSLVGQRVYVDTNIIIFAVERNPTYIVDVAELLIANGRGDVSLVTSELSLAEALVKPTAQTDQKTIAAYRVFLQSRPGFDVVSVSRRILEGSAGVRATQGGALPDAIHVATAIESGCTHFATEDNRIRLPQPLSYIRASDFTAHP